MSTGAWRRWMAAILLVMCADLARGQKVGPPELPDGTLLAIEIEHSVRADRAKAGDKVRAKLIAPVLARGAIAIPAGARIVGVVVAAQPLAPGRPSSLLVHFRSATWRTGEAPLNAYIARQLVLRRTFTTESRQFCPPVERFLPPQPGQLAQQQPAPQPPQQPKPPPIYTPPPPPSPPPKLRAPVSDTCHNPMGVRRDARDPLTFTSPAISGVTLRKLDTPEGPTILESVKKNVTLNKGMMLEIRHHAP